MSTFRGPPPETEPGIGALTMGGLLTEVAARFGTREAVCFHEPAPPDGGRPPVVRWSYGELEGRARRFAKALVAAGAGKGTRVALLMGNRPEWVEAAFGAALAGTVLVPVNTLFEPPEIEHVLGHSDTAVLVYQERLASHRYHEQVRSMSGDLPYLTTLACMGTDGYDTFL
ncbi:MAG TPA: AMP-binding protein, partial [Acidimicrobiales bacterium]|nr:AMP-binding protein [Acidimicrobiales bacterium]